MVIGTLWMFPERRCAVTTTSWRPPALAEVVASAALACGPKAVAAPAVPSTATMARRMVSLEFKWLSPILVEFSVHGATHRHRKAPADTPFALLYVTCGVVSTLQPFKAGPARAIHCHQARVPRDR